MRIIILGLLLLSGCGSDIGDKYKCIGGVTYIKNGNIWIEALYYHDNKCVQDPTNQETTK